MIHDCFTYYNETEILRVRLEELRECVDRHVLVEATETFTGNPKPLYFDELPSWIDEFKDRIHRIVVEFPDKHMTPWEREGYQRNKILDGLQSAEDDDTIVISDADEIPRPNALRHPGSYQLDVTQFFWNYHWQVPEHCNQGARPVVVRMRNMDLPQVLRSKVMDRIPYGGWHFSFFGGPELTQGKIEAFSHTEVDKEEFKEHRIIQYRMANGIDPFDRFPLKWTDIDETYPKWVQSSGR